MNNSSFKIKYFKNTIVGLKAVLTYCTFSKKYTNKTGKILAGYKSYRFFFELDDDKTIIPLFEEDEICLIPKE